MNLELVFSEKPLLKLSPYLMESLSLKEGQKLWVYAGSVKRNVSVMVHEGYRTMVMDEKTAGELKISAGNWEFRRDKEGVRLGPVIGIVCNKITQYSPEESNWARYLKTMKGGLGILLNQESFDLKRRCVKGRVLSQGEWIDGEFPWPDALYIQVYPVTESFRLFLEEEFKNRYFNGQTHFDKWVIYKLLSKTQGIKKYLPETDRFDDDPQKLEQWLSKYKEVYLKPVLRSQGLGIVKVKKLGENHLVEYREGRRNKEALVPLDMPVRDAMGSIFGKRQYIIQQGLSLAAKDSRTSDLRVLMQKKEDGIWHVTGIGGRQGARHSVVNNLDNGGDRISGANYLKLQNVDKNYIRKIIYVCEMTALTLEKELGILGEIGIDIGVDEVGHIWIIEVNGRPDKTFFTHGYPEALAKNVYAAPVQYARYLGGFSEVVNPLVGRTDGGISGHDTDEEK